MHGVLFMLVAMAIVWLVRPTTHDAAKVVIALVIFVFMIFLLDVLSAIAAAIRESNKK